jgi:hypothetical protein
MTGYIMVKLVPECVKCGSSVIDSLESEVEEQGQIKRGKYINSVCQADVSPNTPKADKTGL